MDILFEDKEDVLDRAQEARQEALKACSLDEGRSYYEAIEHYDQAITVIDEILRDISADAPVWERLIVFRQNYSERMVLHCIFMYLDCPAPE